MHNILITGGSGLIGRRLTEHLQARGHRVMWLSHSHAEGTGVYPNGGIYRWNVNKGLLDERPLRTADTIIHLAGVNIGDKPWTPSRKREIMRSRALGARLLCNQLEKMSHYVKTYISASAIGYYDMEEGPAILTEDAPLGTGFLAKTCRLWEREADRFESRLGVRKVIFRNGLVLSNRGGILRKMSKPFKYGFNTPVGSGLQYFNWIHIDDLCGVYLSAVEREDIKGVYNAVSPAPLTNDQFNYAMAYVFGGNHVRIAIPEKAVRFVLGEMSSLILEGKRVSAEKIIDTGFEFVYCSVNQALRSFRSR